MAGCSGCTQRHTVYGECADAVCFQVVVCNPILTVPVDSSYTRDTLQRFVLECLAQGAREKMTLYGMWMLSKSTASADDWTLVAGERVSVAVQRRYFLLE